MRIEETEKGEKRVFMAKGETDRLLNHYDETPRKWLALALMCRCGLRVKEATDVSRADLHKDDGTYWLEIPEGKRGHRDVYAPQSVASKVKDISNLEDLDATESVLGVTDRTVKNWVYRAAENAADETGEERFNLVSAHDLRRSWASQLLDSGTPETAVMELGGWKNWKTFKEHYQKTSNTAAKQYSEKAGFE